MAPAALKTTVIGSYPKPCCCKDLVPDWFMTQTDLTNMGGDQGSVTDRMNELLKGDPAELEKKMLQATEEVLQEQIAHGIDIPTDGEVRRENYIHHLCRKIEGISFEQLTHCKLRPRTDEATGETVYAYETRLPTVVGSVKWRAPREQQESGTAPSTADPFPPRAVVAEWLEAQKRGGATPVKYTLPGPMTIIGTVCNKHYADGQAGGEQQLAKDLAVLVKECVDALVDAGCKNVQVDEPLYARKPKDALEWGIRLLDFVLGDVPACVTTTVHICCGYPQYLDHKDYVKADNNVYTRLAPALNKSKVTAVSIEDAHRNNDLATLLPLLCEKTIVFGCVKVASSEVESVEEIAERLRLALKYVSSPDKLIAAPDCGLAYLTPELCRQKLHNLVAAAAMATADLKGEEPAAKRPRA